MASADKVRALRSTVSSDSADLALFSDLLTAMPDHLATEDHDDPTTYAKAMASSDAASWTAALQKEFPSLCDLGIYKLVPRVSVPRGCKIMKGCPIFKLKRDQHGLPVRYKARYVCRGYSAVWGQDFRTHCLSRIIPQPRSSQRCSRLGDQSARYQDGFSLWPT